MIIDHTLFPFTPCRGFGTFTRPRAFPILCAQLKTSTLNFISRLILDSGQRPKLIRVCPFFRSPNGYSVFRLLYSHSFYKKGLHPDLQSISEGGTFTLYFTCFVSTVHIRNFSKMGLLPLTYRRPQLVDKEKFRKSVSSDNSSENGHASFDSEESGASAGVPEALTFDKIITGGTCPVSTDLSNTA